MNVLKRRLLLIVAATAGLALACTGTESGRSRSGLTFTGLPATDSMRAHIVLDGEWGDSAYELRFRGGPQHVVSVVKIAGDWVDGPKEFRSRRRTAPVETRLTEDDLRGLDELLRYYRDEPPDSCTDTHIITVERLRGEKTIDRKRYIDKSCGAEDVEGVTTLLDIVHRVDFPKQ